MKLAHQKNRYSEAEKIEHYNQFCRRFKKTNVGKWAEKDQPYLTYTPKYS